VVAQVMLLDIVFSLDSVITAVGMANTLWVMAAAIVIAVAIMLAASKPLADFVERHPHREDAGIEFPVADRHDVDRGRRRLRRPQGVYIRCDRILGRGRDLEPVGRRASAPSAAVAAG
jgi:integral membrane protein TerC family protein